MTSLQSNKTELIQNTAYPFEQARGVYIQGTAALNLMGATILTGLFIHNITCHKHRDKVTSGEPALISLKEERGSELSAFGKDFKAILMLISTNSTEGLRINTS